MKLTELPSSPYALALFSPSFFPEMSCPVLTLASFRNRKLKTEKGSQPKRGNYENPKETDSHLNLRPYLCQTGNFCGLWVHDFLFFQIVLQTRHPQLLFIEYVLRPGYVCAHYTCNPCVYHTHNTYIHLFLLRW